VGLWAGLLIVVGIAWALTLSTSTEFVRLLSVQLGGAPAPDRLEYFALTGVMMAAMMLPGAIPMLSAYRGLAAVEAGPREASVRTTLFGTLYVVLWASFAAGSLLILMALGLMGMLAGPWRYVPPALLIGAGLYQFTSLKRYCLTGCQTPVGFLLGHWSGGRSGAVRMGGSHAGFCIGCCWLLMIVWFVAASMSLLWMGIFAGLILAEKGWTRGPWLSAGVGIAAMAAGVLVLALP
jgi:predicted metal-binding membrane protein